MQPTSHGRVPLIGMDEFEPPPTCQALRGVAEIFDSPLIQVVELALRGTAPDQCRNRLDQQAKLTLALTKRVFRALSIFDVCVDPVPLDDVSFLVAQRIRAEQEPSIVAVVPTQPRFGLPRRFGSHDALPCRGQTVQILGVDGSRPAPTARLFRRKADEVQIVLVEELGASIWTRRPGQRRNRVDDELEIAFARAERLLGTLPLVDVRQQHAPANDVAAGSRTGNPLF